LFFCILYNVIISCYHYCSNRTGFVMKYRFELFAFLMILFVFVSVNCSELGSLPPGKNIDNETEKSAEHGTKYPKFNQKIKITKLKYPNFPTGITKNDWNQLSKKRVDLEKTVKDFVTHFPGNKKFLPSTLSDFIIDEIQKEIKKDDSFLHVVHCFTILHYALAFHLADKDVKQFFGEEGHHRNNLENRIFNNHHKIPEVFNEAHLLFYIQIYVNNLSSLFGTKGIEKMTLNDFKKFITEGILRLYFRLEAENWPIREILVEALWYLAMISEKKHEGIVEFLIKKYNALNDNQKQTVIEYSKHITFPENFVKYLTDISKEPVKIRREKEVKSKSERIEEIISLEVTTKIIDMDQPWQKRRASGLWRFISTLNQKNVKIGLVFGGVAALLLTLYAKRPAYFKRIFSTLPSR
jgi:hypothetical protein